MKEVNHFRRVVLWWVAMSIPATLIVVLVLAPGLPPGNGTGQAAGQVVAVEVGRVVDRACRNLEPPRRAPGLVGPKPEDGYYTVPSVNESVTTRKLRCRTMRASDTHLFRP